MSVHFSQTLRALEGQDRGLRWFAPVAALICLWLCWIVWARVDVYATTTQARVEVSRIPSRVAALDDGRIVAQRCALGLWVEPGDVLIELDTSLERAQLERERQELASARAKADGVKQQIAADQARRSSRWRMDEVATRQAQVALERARVESAHQDEVATIAAHLHEQRLTARMDAVNAETDLVKTRLEIESAKLELDRLRAVQHYQDKAELASISELRRTLTEFESEQLVHEAEIAAVLARIERRKVLAPVRGRLGYAAPLQVGDVLRSGDVVASIVPPAEVRVVAEFSPDDAVGRIEVGQPAHVRFAAYSFMEYGVVEARVAHFGNEPHQGSVRVELELLAQNPQRVPLQHGMPGAVDVRVDRASPWSLVARSIGVVLAAGAAAERVR